MQITGEIIVWVTLNENNYLFVIIFLMLVCIAVFRFTCCKAKENPSTGMPDPEFVRKQKTVEKVNMVYGTDKCPITLYRPVDAYFTVAPGTALNARDRVWLRANDSSWSAEVLWDLKYTVSKKKFQSVTSKVCFASCSIPKDNL